VKGEIILNYYEQIKGLLISNEIYKRVKDYSKNKSDLETYYNVGKLIIEAQGGESRARYGDGLIKDYSKKLMVELNDRKYSYRNLMNMRKFYLKFKGEKVNALRSQLSWSHYRELLSINNENEIKYYIDLALTDNLSYRELAKRIKSNDYKRLSLETRKKLENESIINLKDIVPNPIIIKNVDNMQKITEKVLHKIILEDIESFMKELGNSFCFIGSEYKIKIGDRNYYIDILLFNYKYNCFVVVELKVTEFRAEYISQVQKYMNYIDKNVKEPIHNNTMGILICKRDNRFVIEYCSDERIAVREYKLI
jgi:predicted nuclease of restriction endonuclease-like (RecB) superfamily